MAPKKKSPKKGGSKGKEKKKTTTGPKPRRAPKTEQTVDSGDDKKFTGPPACDAFVRKVETVGLAGLRTEFSEVKGFLPQLSYNASLENRAKNRFADVVCLDESRVILTLNVPPEGDYIHANWIRAQHMARPFIATQGTVEDFWRMIHQEQPVAIVVIGNFVENVKEEEEGRSCRTCPSVWSTGRGRAAPTGTTAKWFLSYSKDHLLFWFVANKKVEPEDKWLTYSIEVLPDGCSNSTLLKIIHFTDWPDRGVPHSGRAALRLLAKLREMLPLSAPLVVHCSAGIGRTGALIALEIAVQRLLKGIPVDVKDVFLEVRRQRMSSVQTEAQYVWIHQACLDYIRFPGLAKRAEKPYTELKTYLTASQQPRVVPGQVPVQFLPAQGPHSTGPGTQLNTLGPMSARTQKGAAPTSFMPLPQ